MFPQSSWPDYEPLCSDYDLRTWHFAGLGDWQMSLENVGKFRSPGMQMSEACKVRRTFQKKKKVWTAILDKTLSGYAVSQQLLINQQCKSESDQSNSQTQATNKQRLVWHNPEQDFVSDNPGHTVHYLAILQCNISSLCVLAHLKVRQVRMTY